MEYKMTDNNKEKLNFYQKLHNVTSNLEMALKEKNKNMPYSTVNHNEVTTKVKKQIKENRLFLRPIIGGYSKKDNHHREEMSVEIIDIDNPTDRMTVGKFPAIGFDSQDKGYGKAISYAYKYILQKTFMMEIGDDEEVDAHTTDIDYEDLDVDFRYLNKNGEIKWTSDNHKEYQKKINGLCYYMIQKQDFKNLPTLQANQKELIRCKQKITNDPTKYDPNESSINFTLGVIDSALKILDSNTDNNNIIKDDNDAHN